MPSPPRFAIFGFRQLGVAALICLGSTAWRETTAQAQAPAAKQTPAAKAAPPPAAPKSAAQAATAPVSKQPTPATITPKTPTQPQPPSEPLLPVGLAKGEMVYVPIYSSVYYETAKHTIELAATLSIHNVNPDKPITLVRADYYNTDGKLIKKYLDKPQTMNALQTVNLVVEKSNVAGGPGANFLVEWQSREEVTSPLIEAVMMNASSNQGIAFTTSGKVIRRAESAGK